jgi:cyclomaltodextrin glucanotransferase
VLLDVVCNHTSAGAPGAPKGELYDDGRYLTSYEDDRLGWYNRHGPIRDWDSPHELAKGELRGLADFNEDVWTFRRYITETMAAWLDRGVDGFRLDAVKHMALSFWQEFTATMRKHKPEVVLFGEWSGIGPWDTRGLHFANNAGMSVLDFNFHYGVHDVFCKNQSFRRFADVLHNDRGYDDATELVTFLDNHDVPRLLSVGMKLDDLPLAVTLLMTSRGVPCLFYGTEQALFDGTDGGQDPYNRPMMERFELDTPVAKILPALAALRRRSLAVQRGFTRELYVGQDVFAFARAYHRAGVVVIINRGKATRLALEGVPLPDGLYRDLLGVLPEPVKVSARAAHAHGARARRHRPRAPRGPARRQGAGRRAPQRLHLALRREAGGARRRARAGPMDPTRTPCTLHYVNENLWTGDLLFDESAGRRSSIATRSSIAAGTIRHEDRLPRVARAPACGVLSWKDRFEG